MPKYAAAIDLGTNSFRLLIAERLELGFRPLAKELVSVRLGQHLHDSGSLSEAAQNRALQALALFAAKIQAFGAMPIKACGTAALRQATNSALFSQKAAAILGAPINILSATAEARLAIDGALSATPISGPVCFVDAGGGSTEIAFIRPVGKPPGKALVAGTAHLVDKVCSIPVGAVTLTEQFFSRLPPWPAELEAITRFLDLTFSQDLPPLGLGADHQPAPLMVMGAGGTASALAAMDLGLPNYDPRQLQGHILTTERLRHLRAGLCQTASPTQPLPGLDHGRGEIILAGLLIFESLLGRLGSTQFTVSEAGLLEGILLSI